MRGKSRILVIAFAIIGASMALDAILVNAYSQVEDVSKGTETVGMFLDCINKKIKDKADAGETADISDTVGCLPGCCTVTLTMSEDSAQAACFSGGAEKCQLPRVILKCPGPPQVEFTYLLCGTGSVGADNVIGSNRVEVGVVVGQTGSGTVMVMADIPVPPGTPGNIMDVISVGTNGVSKRGSKGCNACHGDAGLAAGTGTPQLSERIEAFGTTDAPATARNPSFIIDTDDCEVQEKIEGIPLADDLKKQNLSGICDCIDMAIKNGNFDTVKGADGKVIGTVTAEQAQVVQKLCHELRDYQKNRDMSGTCTPCISPTPTPTGTPTAITLLYFKAKAGGKGNVALTWKTATEIDNAGFNIYRARGKSGDYKKVNNALIPAQGNATTGASYRYQDTPPSRGTYYYKLEDVDYSGESTMHGPEKVKSGNNASRRSK